FRLDVDVYAVGVLRHPGDAMGEAHIEIAGIGVFGGDRGGQLVLLVLQDEWKFELVVHALEIEFGDHPVRDPVVEAVLGRYEPERNDLPGDAELVEQFERRRMNRSRALVFDRRGLLLEHGDRHAAPVERERAYHADRTGADHDYPMVRIRSGHSTLTPAAL